MSFLAHIPMDAAAIARSEAANAAQIAALKPRRTRTEWTDDKVLTLRTMWSRGQPALQIARAIGVSRGAILGKAHRLGLPDARETAVDALRMAVAQHGTISAAARALGWSVHRAKRWAVREGIKPDAVAVRRAKAAGARAKVRKRRRLLLERQRRVLAKPAGWYDARRIIPSKAIAEMAQRGPRWLAAYRAAGGDERIYTATRAADAAILGAHGDAA